MQRGCGRRTSRSSRTPGPAYRSPRPWARAASRTPPAPGSRGRSSTRARPRRRLRGRARETPSAKVGLSATASTLVSLFCVAPGGERTFQLDVVGVGQVQNVVTLRGHHIDALALGRHKRDRDAGRGPPRRRASTRDNRVGPRRARANAPSRASAYPFPGSGTFLSPWCTAGSAITADHTGHQVSPVQPRCRATLTHTRRRSNEPRAKPALAASCDARRRSRCGRSSSECGHGRRSAARRCLLAPSRPPSYLATAWPAGAGRRSAGLPAELRPSPWSLSACVVRQARRRPTARPAWSRWDEHMGHC